MNALKIVMVSALSCVLLPGAAIADKMDCSSSKKMKQEISNQVVELGDRAGHKMHQTVRVHVHSSKNPEMDGAEEMEYQHMDHVNGTGTHRGYSMVTYKSGERVWSYWEGVQHLVLKGGDSWEVPYEGVFTFIAGTGKYKSIRGGGYYRGIATPTGITEDDVCEAEY
jgi:hypothetical protein